MSELSLSAARRGALVKSIRKLPLGLRMLAIVAVAIVAIVFPAFEGSDSFVMYTATQALVYGLAIVSLNLRQPTSATHSARRSQQRCWRSTSAGCRYRSRCWEPEPRPP